MTPSIDVSLPAAPSATRQSAPASAAAPVTFQDCLDGVPPADIPKGPPATGGTDEAQTDEPRTRAKPVDDPATLAALAALSTPVQLTAVDGAASLLGSATGAPVAGQTAAVVDGAASTATRDAGATTTVDPALVADVESAMVAGQVAPASSGADAIAGAATGDARAAATATSPNSTLMPASSSLPATAAVAPAVTAASAPTKPTDAAAAGADSVPDSAPASGTLAGGRPTDQLDRSSRTAGSPTGASSIAGPSHPISARATPSPSAATSPAAAPAPESPSVAVASRRNGADSAKVEGSTGSPNAAIVAHEPSRTGTGPSTLAEPSSRTGAPTVHVDGASDRATATHTGPMHLDVDLGGEGLGPLRLRATSVAGQLHVSMTATDVRVRSALLDRSVDLKRDMRSAGLDLTSFDVNGSAHGRTSEGDQSGRSSSSRSDDASRSSTADADAPGSAPVRRVSAAASSSRLDLLL